MKRKYDEGYALVFTLVVVLFLSIVAMFMMQLAGRDLTAQQASIDRMKNQYEAQGRIEEIVGKLENNAGTRTLTEIFGAVPEVEGVLNDNSYVTATVRIPSEDDGTDKYQVTITCTLKLTARTGSSFATESGGGYALTGPCSVEYLSYEISAEPITRQNPEGGDS